MTTNYQMLQWKDVIIFIWQKVTKLNFKFSLTRR